MRGEVKLIMLLNKFLKVLNFTEHPFTKVAGEKEELLQLYFVEPRYFSEVLGDARNPKSYVVFGPRGGGKSAIRSMIERYCNDTKSKDDIGGKVLSITYDDFSALNLRRMNTINLSDHINEILKRGVAQLAIELVKEGIIGDKLKEEFRGLLRWYIDEYMSDLTKLELDSILKALKGRDDNIKELISNALDLYNTFISALKLEHIQPAQPIDTPKKSRDVISSIHVMDIFIRLSVAVGFDAVYVLVDKIDETDVTGADIQKAAKLVSPMLTNIKLLELENCAFKFFLWENIRTQFGDELRSDRIPMKTIEWTDRELSTMLSRRVAAYSLNRTTLNDIFEERLHPIISSILTTFAYKSPRDINRLMESIFSEATPDATIDDIKIKQKSVFGGIERFSMERASELYTSNIVNRVVRLKKDTFTISDIATTFKITGARSNDGETVDKSKNTNKARSIVESWKKTGMIEQTDSITPPGKRRPVNQYEIVDPRVKFLINPSSLFSND